RCASRHRRTPLSARRCGRRSDCRSNFQKRPHGLAAPRLRRTHPVWRHSCGAAAMTNILFAVAIGLATGILSGFGIGGGSLLMLWLTCVMGVSQRDAAGMNLLYFLACAPPALISHWKNQLIDKKAALFCI